MVSDPRGSYMVLPLLSLEVTTPEYESTNSRCQPHARKSVSKAVLSRMQLAPHATRRTPHGASRLVQAMSAWSVKTRRAPSRHYRDASVYGHTTTATHEIEYTPPPPPAPSTQMLEVSLLGVGTALRLETDAWSTIKDLRSAPNEHASKPSPPPTLTSPPTSIV